MYKIKGLRISKKYLDNPKYRAIEYSTFLCKMAIASDDFGTQICYNGRFFGGNFKNVEEGVEYLREHKEEAVKFFRKVYIQRLGYKFSWRNIETQYWRIRHHFDPNFYLIPRRKNHG